MIDREYWDGIVSQPGRFEGQFSFVPYLWINFVIEGLTADTIVNNYQKCFEIVDVNDDVIKAFPEIKGFLNKKNQVALTEFDNGWVQAVKWEFTGIKQYPETEQNNDMKYLRSLGMAFQLCDEKCEEEMRHLEEVLSLACKRLNMNIGRLMTEIHNQMEENENG